MSGIATGTALAIGLGAAATTTAGVLGYEGQKGVANASKSAAETQAQEAQNALDFQKQQWQTQQQNQAPFLKAGQGAVGELSRLTSTPGQGLLTPWSQQFQAPTAAEAEATPGYQFTLQQGLSALQNSAAAQGNLLSGGTQAALGQYSQGLASNTYQQSFNNALTQYQQSYNQFQQNQANEFNRLASISGLGQTTAGQLGQEGQAASNNVSNVNLTTGAQQGQDLVNQASATASGYNAIGNGISSAANYANLIPLYNLMNQSGANYGGAAPGENPNQYNGQ